jgi:hypothetical protein
MSHQINTAIELSSEELDLVAGGAITDTEAATYKLTDNALVSGFSVGPGGTQSFTQATNFKIASTGAKQVSIS